MDPEIIECGGLILINLEQNLSKSLRFGHSNAMPEFVCQVNRREKGQSTDEVGYFNAKLPEN